MSKHKKQYVIPLRSPEEKQKIRDWVGTHNGMSILKTEEVFDLGFSTTFYDVYFLGITNPKTEMLFVLSFPEAIEKEQFESERRQDWEDNRTTTG